jgi:hypothetical protein
MGGINKTVFALTSSKSFESGVFPSPFTSSLLILEVKGEGNAPLSKLLLEVRANAFFYSYHSIAKYNHFIFWFN